MIKSLFSGSFLMMLPRIEGLHTDFCAVGQGLVFISRWCWSCLWWAPEGQPGAKCSLRQQDSLTPRANAFLSWILGHQAVLATLTLPGVQWPSSHAKESDSPCPENCTPTTVRVRLHPAGAGKTLSLLADKNALRSHGDPMSLHLTPDPVTMQRRDRGSFKLLHLHFLFCTTENQCSGRMYFKGNDVN